ncbi:MAG: DUF1638 domain-containing protein [Tepidisphaeraceae bacterium]
MASARAASKAFDHVALDSSFRAHDCITLLLGSRQRYAEYVHAHPGTYWYSRGWNRHHAPPGPQRYQQALDRYRATFDEDDAQYLMQTEQSWLAHYNRASFADLGLCDSSADERFTKECADWLGWTFDRQAGDPSLLRDLLFGPWDEDRFLVLEPGQTVTMTADDRVMDRVAEPVTLTVHGQPIGGLAR